MSGPARAGVLIYAKRLESLYQFYEQLLGLKVIVADTEHRIAENNDVQLVFHRIPAHLAADIVINSPSEPREEQAIKPYFTVPSLAAAETDAKQLGGFLFGPVWDGHGFMVRNACDPEGNIIQLREKAT